MPERAARAIREVDARAPPCHLDGVLIAQRDDCYLRDPRLVSRADGGADLHVVAWDAAGEEHRVITLDAHGALLSESALERRPSILGLTHDRGAPRIAEDVAEEDRARDGAWTVAIERERATGSSRVVVQGPGVQAIAWEARAIAAAPAIAVAPTSAGEEGAWIAFTTSGSAVSSRRS